MNIIYINARLLSSNFHDICMVMTTYTKYVFIVWVDELTKYPDESLSNIFMYAARIWSQS